MNTITLWQPWASFMAWGIKTIETRHWPLPKSLENKPIAIHAAKKIARITNPHFEDAMIDQGLSYDDLPTGFILCYFEKVRCAKITGKNSGYPEYPERAFGDYTPGRYMWIMEELNVLPWPVMIKGKQGIWNWDTTMPPIDVGGSDIKPKQRKLF